MLLKWELTAILLTFCQKHYGFKQWAGLLVKISDILSRCL